MQTSLTLEIYYHPFFSFSVASSYVILSLYYHIIVCRDCLHLSIAALEPELNAAPTLNDVKQQQVLSMYLQEASHYSLQYEDLYARV